MKGEEEIVGVAVVCVLATDRTHFTDNVNGECHFCRRTVQHRPYVPQPNTLVCRLCFLERVEDGDEAIVSRETAIEAHHALSRN